MGRKVWPQRKIETPELFSSRAFADVYRNLQEEVMRDALRVDLEDCNTGNFLIDFAKEGAER